MSTPSLGSCCHCSVIGPMVRNICALPYKSPYKLGRWGCAVCGLPGEGAVAVMCDACLKANKKPRFYCVGYPGRNVRASIASIKDRPHKHDPTKHPELLKRN